MKLTHRRAVLLMVICGLLWSTAGVVTRHLEAAKAFEVTFWRSFFTVLSLVVILPWVKGRGVFKQTLVGGTSLWLSGLCWSAMFTAYMVALTLTTVANVLVMLALGPLLTALLARFVVGHHVPRRTWLAIALAGVGIVWMYGGQADLRSQLTGTLVALAVPLAAACNWTVVQHSQAIVWMYGGQADLRSQLTGTLVALAVPLAAACNWTVVQHSQAQGHKVDLVPAVLVGAVVSCLVVLPLAWPLTATAHDVGLLAGLGLMQLAVPCVLSVWCASMLKAPEMALLASLEIIFGILLAWAGAGEVPGTSVLYGGALVVGSLVLNELMAWKDKR